MQRTSPLTYTGTFSGSLLGKLFAPTRVEKGVSGVIFFFDERIPTTALVYPAPGFDDDE